MNLLRRGWQITNSEQSVIDSAAPVQSGGNDDDDDYDEAEYQSNIQTNIQSTQSTKQPKTSKSSRKDIKQLDNRTIKQPKKTANQSNNQTMEPSTGPSNKQSSHRPFKFNVQLIADRGVVLVPGKGVTTFTSHSLINRLVDKNKQTISSQSNNQSKNQSNNQVHLRPGQDVAYTSSPTILPPLAINQPNSQSVNQSERLIGDITVEFKQGSFDVIETNLIDESTNQTNNQPNILRRLAAPVWRTNTQPVNQSIKQSNKQSNKQASNHSTFPPTEIMFDVDDDDDDEDPPIIGSSDQSAHLLVSDHQQPNTPPAHQSSTQPDNQSIKQTIGSTVQRYLPLWRSTQPDEKVADETDNQSKQILFQAVHDQPNDQEINQSSDRPNDLPVGSISVSSTNQFKTPQSVKQPAEHPIEQPAEKSVNQPKEAIKTITASPSNKQTFKQSNKEPVNPSILLPSPELKSQINQPPSHPINQSNRSSFFRSINSWWYADDNLKQPINLSITQSLNQSIDQSFDQPFSGTVNIVIIGLHGWSLLPMIGDRPFLIATRFCFYAQQAVDEYFQSINQTNKQLSNQPIVPKITCIPLHGHGSIDQRINRSMSQLSAYQSAIQSATHCLLVSHSQGGVVGTGVMERLIDGSNHQSLDQSDDQGDDDEEDELDQSVTHPNGNPTNQHEDGAEKPSDAESKQYVTLSINQSTEPATSSQSKTQSNNQSLGQLRLTCPHKNITLVMLGVPHHGPFPDLPNPSINQSFNHSTNQLFQLATISQSISLAHWQRLTRLINLSINHFFIASAHDPVVPLFSALAVGIDQSIDQKHNQSVHQSINGSVIHSPNQVISKLISQSDKPNVVRALFIDSTNYRACWQTNDQQENQSTNQLNDQIDSSSKDGLSESSVNQLDNKPTSPLTDPTKNHPMKSSTRNTGKHVTKLSVDQSIKQTNNQSFPYALISLVVFVMNTGPSLFTQSNYQSSNQSNNQPSTSSNEQLNSQPNHPKARSIFNLFRRANHQSVAQPTNQPTSSTPNITSNNQPDNQSVNQNLPVNQSTSQTFLSSFDLLVHLSGCFRGPLLSTHHSVLHTMTEAYGAAASIMFNRSYNNQPSHDSNKEIVDQPTNQLCNQSNDQSSMEPVVRPNKRSTATAPNKPISKQFSRIKPPQVHLPSPKQSNKPFKSSRKRTRSLSSPSTSQPVKQLNKQSINQSITQSSGELFHGMNTTSAAFWSHTMNTDMHFSDFNRFMLAVRTHQFLQSINQTINQTINFNGPQEINQLVALFECWSPKTKQMKWMKEALAPVFDQSIVPLTDQSISPSQLRIRARM